MRIAILGSGRVGSTLAARLADAGHEIHVGSRSPSAGQQSHADAVAGAEVVVLATPGGAVLPLLESLGEEALGERVLLDVANAVGPDFNLLYPNDSLARRIQERFPKVRVVKSLNTVNTSVMANPAALPEPTTVFLSGDDADAKGAVRSIVRDLGWTDEQVLDLGGVDTAVGPEHYFRLYFAIARVVGSPTLNMRLVTAAT